jgi:hypothetical protein
VDGGTYNGNTDVGIYTVKLGDFPSPGTAVFQNFTATGNARGVLITGSDVRTNGVGIQASDDGASGNVANGNNIVGNGTGAINLDPDDSFDALSNYWGCAGGPGAGGCDTVSGNVLFDPWLTEETPAQVPGLGWYGMLLIAAFVGFRSIRHLSRQQ